MNDTGLGMLIAGMGSALATDLGILRANAAEVESALNFGALEPLVALMQETPPNRLNAILVEKLRSGTSLKTLLDAGALANARTFGGQDYIGFHTFMALAPAWHMSQELPLADSPIGEAFNHLQFAVEDEVDVHRVVLAWRAWDTIELAGEEWSHCLLRQSIRYCTRVEHDMNERGHQHSPIREVLPKHC